MTFIDNPDREVIQILKRSAGAIDLIIPRGGNALKEALAGSAVPVLPHFDGICHTYVDRAADLQDGRGDLLQRQMQPALGLQCDGESMLVHAGSRGQVPAAHRRADGGRRRRAARLRRARARSSRSARPATDADWDTEYLDLILAIKVVDSIDEAIVFIARHGSGLADAIVTED